MMQASSCGLVRYDLCPPAQRATRAVDVSREQLRLSKSAGRQTRQQGEAHQDQRAGAHCRGKRGGRLEMAVWRSSGGRRSVQA